jgi:SAM-dependent methyltransferase
MDREQYTIMFEVERSHWWYRSMRRNALALLRRYLAPGRRYQLLDAGCGTGGTTIDLQQFGSVTGVDMSTDALGYASSRGLDRLVRGSIEALPFSDATFDAWTCFDVQYHRAVAEERRAMEEARRVLKPGGLAFFREPAFNWLRGAHDVGIHTARRFTLDAFTDEIKKAGFHIEHATYGNMLLFPLALLKRSVDRFLPGSPTDLSVPPAPLNAAFEALVSLEGPLLGQTRLPLGLSVIVVARA